MALPNTPEGIQIDLAARLQRTRQGKNFVKLVEKVDEQSGAFAPLGMISETLIADDTGSTTSGVWNTFSLPNTIPSRARFAYVAFRAQAIENGEAFESFVRASAGSDEYSPLHVATIEGADDVASNDCWAFVPMNIASRSFQWKVEFTGTPTWSVKLLGYHL